LRCKTIGSRRRAKKLRSTTPKKKSIKLRGSLYRIIRQIKKEFKLLWTDKFNLILAIIIPPVVILLFGSMLNAIPPTPQPVPCVIISYDSNTIINPNNYTESRINNYTIPYVNAVNKSELLKLEHFYNASEEIYAMETARMQLISGKIKVIISIPTDFSEFIIWGLPALIDCIPDSSDVQHIQDNLNAVYDSVKIFVNDNNLTPQFIIQGYEEFAIPEGYSLRFNYNATLLLAFIAFGVSMVLTILVVVQEKPVARLLLTPVKRTEILLFL